MKLNPADQCLSLVLRTLTNDILPEVKSAAGQGAVHLITATLTDLLKRHRDPSIQLLRTCIDSGRLLGADMERALHSKHNANDSEHLLLPSEASFEDLAKVYGQLTERLHILCGKLSLSRTEIPETASLLHRAARWEAQFPAEQAKLAANPFGEGSAQESSSSPPVPLHDFLQDFLSNIHGPLEVTKVKEVVGGFGKETYFAEITYPTGVVEEVVVRKDQPVPLIGHGGFLIEREYHILKSLSATGFPAPKPIDLAYKTPGGTFFTMERLPGDVLANGFLGIQSKYPEDILKQLAELLAQLHRTPLEKFRPFFEEHNELDALHDTVEDCYRRGLKEWRAYVSRVEHLPSPYIMWLFDWLENNIPDDKRPAVLTHGDFSTHNVLAQDGKITAVLDWESAAFGAPEQDVGYVKANIAGDGDFDIFLRYYKAAGGFDISQENMTFCLAYQVLRFFVASTRSTLNLQRGTNRDIRYVMMELGVGVRYMEMGLQYAEDDDAKSTLKSAGDKPAVVETLGSSSVAPVIEALSTVDPVVELSPVSLPPVANHASSQAPVVAEPVIETPVTSRSVVDDNPKNAVFEHTENVTPANVASIFENGITPAAI